MADIYTHGHHESVLRGHRWRTAANSAAYLLPRLRPGQQLLDVGCGPGTVTLDLAAHVAPGKVIGVDRSVDVVADAQRAQCHRRSTNVRFLAGDGYALACPDCSFDVVHAHQLLQHLSDPVAALKEMRRVLRPGGLLAVRDSDYGGFVWAPADPLLDRWLDLYLQVRTCHGAVADAGRCLPRWVRLAGFGELQVSSSTWTFADPASRSWWADSWADRVCLSAFADQAVGYGLTDRNELAAIAAVWRRWAAHPDGFFAVLHGEVMARR